MKDIQVKTRFSRFSKRVVRSVLLVVVLECAVFNFPFWESLFFNGSRNMSFVAGPGLSRNTDGSYSVVDSNKAYIEFDAENQHVDNIHLELSIANWSATSWRDGLGPFVPIKLSVTDASSSLLFDLPEREYCGRINETHYLRVHLSGASQEIRLSLGLSDGTNFSISHLLINDVLPFSPSIARLVVLTLVVVLFQLFRPSSRLYASHMDISHGLTRALVIGFVAAEVLFVLCVGRLTGIRGSAESDVPGVSGQTIMDFNQYNYLADALLEGLVSLDLPVADTLREMDNPYDTNARNKALEASGEYYYLDYAYYNGSYYSYFGILPAITMFMPYKALTGHDLSTARVVSILSIAYVICANILLYSAMRWLRLKWSLGSFLLASLSFVTCSGLLYLVFLPQLYSVPILMGLSCVFCGISCWLTSRREDDVACYSKPKLALGGFCVALSLACRPHYVLAALFAFPIFWDGIAGRLFFSKKGLANTLSVMLPFVVVAIPVMYYNYVRFGSLFDFGAAYNLTGSDMTSRGIDLARTMPALFQYLFQPITISASFPYIQLTDMSVDYQGFWFYEPYLGGFISYAPFCIVLPLAFTRRQALSRGAFGLIAFLLLIAGFILFADFQVASITTRYFNDFSWMLILAAWILIWSLGQRGGKNWLTVTTTLVALGVVVNVLALFSSGRYAPLVDQCPSLYYTVASWLSFL